jgi:hypothetical protein
VRRVGRQRRDRVGIGPRQHEVRLAWRSQETRRVGGGVEQVDATTRVVDQPRRNGGAILADARVRPGVGRNVRGDFGNGPQSAESGHDGHDGVGHGGRGGGGDGKTPVQRPSQPAGQDDAERADREQRRQKERRRRGRVRRAPEQRPDQHAAADQHQHHQRGAGPPQPARRFGAGGALDEERRDERGGWVCREQVVRQLGARQAEEQQHAGEPDERECYVAPHRRLESPPGTGEPDERGQEERCPRQQVRRPHVEVVEQSARRTQCAPHARDHLAHERHLHEGDAVDGEHVEAPRRGDGRGHEQPREQPHPPEALPLAAQRVEAPPHGDRNDGDRSFGQRREPHGQPRRDPGAARAGVLVQTHEGVHGDELKDERRDVGEPLP